MFFAAPLVYFVGGVFLALSGYYFYTNLNAFITFGFGESIVEHLWQRLFNDVVRIVITVIPLITMRVYAEEKNLGTIELLYTAPLRDWEILASKYLACLGVFVVLIGSTALYPYLVHRIQPFDTSQLVAVYLGMFLLIAAMVAIGVFISSLTETQLIAAMFTYGIVLLLWNLSWNEAAVPESWLGVVSQACAYDHFEPFSRGVIDLRDVVVFPGDHGLHVVPDDAIDGVAAVAGAAMRGSVGLRVLQLLAGALGLAALLTAILLAAYRYNVRFDLSPGSRFTLSDHALAVLRGLTQPVHVTGFIRTEDPRNVLLKDLLWQAARESTKLTYDVVDVNRNPAMAAEFEVSAYGSAVVESGGRRADFTGPAEGQLVGAILAVTQPPKQVYALSGHGECRMTDNDRHRGCTTFGSAIRGEHFEVAELSLFGGRTIPEDADILLIAGPTADPLQAEIEAISAYLDRGGKMLALLDPFVAPRLVELLARYGIKLGEDVVLDPENRLGRWRDVLFGGDGSQPAAPNHRHPEFPRVVFGDAIGRGPRRRRERP